jgi:hypothetical protein
VGPTISAIVRIFNVQVIISSINEINFVTAAHGPRERLLKGTKKIQDDPTNDDIVIQTDV